MSLLNDFGLNGLAILWGLFVFVVSFTLSMAMLVFVLTKLPATYFRGSHSPRLWAERHPVLRLPGLASKNLLASTARAARLLT